MRGSDLFFRGRGADIGVRAPVSQIRVAGALLAFAVVTVADSLGFITLSGIPVYYLRLAAIVIGAIIAPTLAGFLLWWFLFAFTGLHLLISFTPVVRPMISPFVRSDSPAPDAQAIIVLSGGMNDEGRISGQALSRLISAMELVHERNIPSLALSVTHEVRKGRTFSSEADQRALVRLGAPQADLRFVNDVFSTRDEALTFAALARTHGWESIVVVTSPLHSARACAAIQREGLRVECHPADLREYSLMHLNLPENRRKAFGDVLYESAAWLLYKARGWM